jgi:hypothetical protein
MALASATKGGELAVAIEKALGNTAASTLIEGTIDQDDCTK